MNCISYDKVIYISHPFQDKLSNLRDIENIILTFKKKYPTYLFLSPCHAFSFEYNEVDYEEGIKQCLWLLQQADECWIFGDWKNSKGCNLEKEFCKQNGIHFTIHINGSKEFYDE